MAAIPTFPNPKDPDATLDYQFDWGSEWLGTDTIATSTFSVSPNSITIETTTNTTTTATVWLSGGAAGTVYSIKNRVVTASGRVDERTIKLKIKER